LSSQSTLHTAFPRDLAAGRYLDLFVVGGVSAVLAIRFIFFVDMRQRRANTELAPPGDRGRTPT
jgi:hypothetical protein